jgi:hypothetical protein
MARSPLVVVSYTSQSINRTTSCLGCRTRRIVRYAPVDAATGYKVWCSAWQYEYLNVAVYKEGLVFISSTGEGSHSSALYGFRGAPPNSHTP